MHADRLLKLADFLDTLPPERFNYSHWVGNAWGGKPDLSCGTTACALGWATAIPEFQAMGLCLQRDGYGEVCVTLGEDVSDCEGAEHSFLAAKKLFGITFRQAEFLFRPDEELGGCDWTAPGVNAKAQDVATHIRRFVAAKQASALTAAKEGGR